MAEPDNDKEVIATLLERTTTQRLPRARDLKKKVDRGELLNELDMAFLGEILTDANSIRTLLERHPEYKDLASNVMNLYHEIAAKALENEKTAR